MISYLSKVPTFSICAPPGVFSAESEPLPFMLWPAAPLMWSALAALFMPLLSLLCEALSFSLARSRSRWLMTCGGSSEKCVAGILGLGCWCERSPRVRETKQACVVLGGKPLIYNARRGQHTEDEKRESRKRSAKTGNKGNRGPACFCILTCYYYLVITTPRHGAREQHLLAVLVRKRGNRPKPPRTGAILHPFPPMRHARGRTARPTWSARRGVRPPAASTWH